MRILYGIHGYGRGHATRALAVLPRLTQTHQVLVLAGGDAYAALGADYPVARIPTLSFVYNSGSGKRSHGQTLRRNGPALLDVLGRGPVFDMVVDMIRDFSPDAIIADAEPWTHAAAAHLRIPRISFDHIGLLAYG